MPADCPLSAGARIVAYLRDSGHADQERSVAQQRRAVETYCERHHLVLIQVYADEARRGGTVVGRDAFEDMIHQLRRLAPEANRRDDAAPAGVLYWDIKRFARNQDDGAFFRADLRRRGYVLISLSDAIPAGDMAPVFEAMLSWKAEQDLRDMAKDIRRGLHDRVLTKDEDGNYVNILRGTVPKGFRAEPYHLGERRSGQPRIVQRIVPDKESGEWDRVRQAFEMRAAGASYEKIHEAVQLYATHGGYYQMFQRSIYMGDLQFGDEVYEGWCEPCVSKEVWDAVQARRLPPGKHKPRQGTSTYTLSGWLRCGQCGAPMTGSTNTCRSGGRTYTYRRYGCTAWRNSGDVACSMRKRLNADRLERAVYDILVEEVLTPDNLRHMLKDARPEDEGRERLERDVARLQADAARAERGIQHLLDAVEQGGNIPGLVERLRKREAVRSRLEAELYQARQQLAKVAAPEVPTALIDAFCTNAREALATGDPEAVRGIMDALVVRVVAWPDGTGALLYRMPSIGDSAPGPEREYAFSFG